MKKDGCGEKNQNLIVYKQINIANFTAAARVADFHFRALKVRAHEKAAIEPNWQTTNNYALSSPEIQIWLQNGGNYGLTCPSGFACFIDADTEEVQRALDDKLPQTFRYSTGKTGHFQYIYMIEDQPIGCIPLKDGAYIKGKGGYALGPGSVHPNGVVYGSVEIRDAPIAIVTHAALMSALEPFLISKPESKGNFNGRSAPATGTAEIDTQALIEILKPYWARANGMRNELTLAIAGFIARAGGSPEDAASVISELARLTGKGEDHIAGARYAFRRTGPLKGFTSLDHILEVIEHVQ